MYRRLNITLPEDVLARADSFAESERYTRSGLIARALDGFIAPAGVPERQAASHHVAESVVSFGHAGSISGAQSTAEDIAALIRAFFAARDDVEAAWLFGSAARGEARTHSDIDLAVLPAVDADDSARWELQLDLATRLPVALGVERVDVVLVPAPSPLLMQRALVDGRRVYGEVSRRAAAVEIRAANEYRDSATLRRMLDRRLTERVDRRAGRR